MESSDPTPPHSDGVPLSSAPQSSSSRSRAATLSFMMETGQRLVDRMPTNPRTVAFISTQERFEVPLRPELWSDFASGAVPASDLQQRDDRPARQHSPITGRGRTKSVRRRRNSSNDPSGVAGGSHVRKTRRTTPRASGRLECPAEQSTRMTDYYDAQGEREVPSRPSRSRQRPPTKGVPHASRDGPTHSMPELPHIHIPRLTDMLSGPLSCLRGPQRIAFAQLFQEIDTTLKENISAIQLSIGNIVRAPHLLATRCRPLLEDLVHAQRITGHSVVGEQSLTNQGCSHGVNIPAGGVQQQNSVPSPVASSHRQVSRGGSAHSSPTGPSHVQHPNPIPSPFASPQHQPSREDDNTGLQNIFHAIPDAECSTRSPIVPTSPYSDDVNLPPTATTENLGKDSETTDSKCPPPSAVAQVTALPVRTASHSSAALDSPAHQPVGKRITFRPTRYVSPFKGGIFLRPQPDVGRAMSLLRYLCADDSPFSSTTVIHSGSNQIRGGVIARSFADNVLPDPVFMSAFVSCVTYDDYFVRPECYGYRIFLGPEVSAILNVECSRRYTAVRKYSDVAAAAAIRVCLPFTDLKRAKMILLPVIHQDHWTVYCVNFVHARIDVLDSMDYKMGGINRWQAYHGQLGKKIISRLSDALSMAAPHKFVCFKNWRHVQVKVPIQKSLSDSLFFAMKFLEWYDGDGHGTIQTNIDTGRPNELRAEMLYYLTFHSENKVCGELPEELLQYRVDDHHPYFY